MLYYEYYFVFETTKYMVMSPDQNAGRSHNTTVYNSSFERMEHLKYLEKILTDQILFRKKIRAD
jgi:hypothetical protein